MAPAALTPRLSLSAVASRAGPRRNRARAPPERIACPLVRAPLRRQLGRVGALPAIIVGAVLLRVIGGVGFANYDTLYALAWGGQLSRGETPAYEVAVAPTPHPLLEALGLALSPLGPRTVERVTVALGFLVLAACGWVVYELGKQWFGRAAGALAALILLTRVPILSYGVRAYADIPYLLLVLSALLVESRALAGERRGGAEERVASGAPVLALLALAGLLRPEAWALSGLYWLYLMTRRRRPRTRRELAGLTLLAALAPIVWVLSDLAITGDALWSLTNTRHTAHLLGRVTGIGNVPQYIPRRIGEILRPPVLVGAALGGVLSLLWLRRRALIGAVAGVVAVVVFVAVAAAGLPINTRYGFLAAAILCVFCGAGAFGWMRLEAGDPRRRWWIAGGALVLLALIAYTPAQYRSAHRELDKLARQQGIEDDLVALVDDRSITLRCGPIGVPNHAPVPLLALYLKTSPARVINAQVNQILSGQYVNPASREVEEDYVLDKRDPHVPVSVPPGFGEVHSNRSWLIFQRC